MARLAMIVAAAENDVIGRHNALPWALPEDLRYFRRVTMGKPVIMGRRTFESIGRPLPGRCNIVVTANTAFVADGVRVVHSLDEALMLAGAVAASDAVDEVMLIGGAQLYALGLPQVERIYLTRVHGDIPGDAFLPPVDWSAFHEVAREHHGASGDNPWAYSFVVYDRAGVTEAADSV
ncbi:dihydrofolate reductase [Pseudohaliea rubra]|nr:dihydrofolate reductase [Pseudohaliea rubra]